MSEEHGQKWQPSALIIDDEQAICESLAGVLADEGWKTKTAHSGRQGIIEFKAHPPDIVFLDVWMPGMDGIETLQSLKGIRSDIPVVIMSGHATIETAVRTTKLGAYEFLEKPMSLEKILPMIEQALALGKGRRGAVGNNGSAQQSLIGDAPSIAQIKKQIQLVAPRNAWVLITGENGTGKEVVATNIHEQSSRAGKPFIAVNCAAIPEQLIESELFGHVKGAFTGAIANQKGKFELADGGTIFLDEIGDMSLKTQAKILRVLQEQRFERLGDDESRHVDVRIVAATNKELSQEIAEGNFREDLFYRLNVIPFQLPPLRERGADILMLANHFLAEFARSLGEPVKSLDDSAAHALQRYHFPGNVRELKNIIERLCIMVPGPSITSSDLPPNMSDPRGGQVANSESLDGMSLKEAKSDFEKQFIMHKLKENQWNVSKTAEAIGIERSNLHRKMRLYQIDPKELKGNE